MMTTITAAESIATATRARGAHDAPRGAVLQVWRPGYDAALSGRLDSRSVGAVRGGLHRFVDAGNEELVLDLSRAEVADSCGLGLLVAAHRRARVRGRTLVLLDPQSRLSRLIRHTRLHRVLVCRSTAR